jgi:ABC-type sugar transport system ATPase subunit
MRGVPKDERLRRVGEAATLLDLDENLLGRKPRQLSGGQLQRVAMGRRELYDNPVNQFVAVRYPPGAPAPGQRHRELSGEVILVEELGADALHVRLAGDSSPVVARAEGRKQPAPGQKVTFNVQPEEVFAFHPTTGARRAG